PSLDKQSVIYTNDLGQVQVYDVSSGPDQPAQVVAEFTVTTSNGVKIDNFSKITEKDFILRQANGDIYYSINSMGEIYKIDGQSKIATEIHSRSGADEYTFAGVNQAQDEFYSYRFVNNLKIKIRKWTPKGLYEFDLEGGPFSESGLSVQIVEDGR